MFIAIGLGGIVVSTLGFLSSGNMILGLIHENMADHWLHLGLGLITLASGFIFSNKIPTTATHAA